MDLFLMILVFFLIGVVFGVGLGLVVELVWGLWELIFGLVELF